MHFGVWRGFERLIFFRSYIFIANLNNRPLLLLLAAYETPTRHVPDDRQTG